MSKKVISEKAHIGFAFDGDGDRLIAVDEKGIEVDGDDLLALFAKNLLKSKKLNKKTVVATIMSNQGFENFLKNKLSVKLIRKNVGDINVISEMQKNNYNLGGEQSGHIILGKYMSTGDGILAALHFLSILHGSSDITAIRIECKWRSSYRFKVISKIYDTFHPSFFITC